MIESAMILEARKLEARALELERPAEGCADPITAAALYRIAALVYRDRRAGGASAAAYAASRAAYLKAKQAEASEAARRAAEPQKELF